MTLGELIVELKQSHGLTDTEIAATLGISERTLRRWVTDGVGRPSRKQAQVLLAMRERGAEVKETLDALYEDLLTADTQNRQEPGS